MSYQILQGDALSVLRTLPAESVHCAVTSPPYFGLRDYKIEPLVWDGEPGCGHEWDAHYKPPPGGKSAASSGLHGAQTSATYRDRLEEQHQMKGITTHFCQCGAWRGSLGLEPTIELYVEHLVSVFRDVRRVLRPEATLWLNLGDCYVTNPHGAGSTFDPKYPGGRDRSEGFRANRTNTPGNLGLKSKDLCGVPERVVLALQADGWYWRSRIPWVKHNGIPESVDDRPTSMVEYLFLLSKSEHAYYDREAGRIPSNGNRGGGRQRAALLGDQRYVRMAAPKDTDGRTGRHAEFQPSSRARRNSDWLFSSLEDYTRDFQGMLLDGAGDPLAMIVNPQPFSLEMCDACETCYDRRDYRQLPAVLTCGDCKRTWDETGPKLSRVCSCGSANVRHVRVCACGARTWVSHFATFPERIVSPCILLGSSEHGCCVTCGAPYERVVEKPNNGDLHPRPDLKAAGVHRLAHTERRRVQVKGTREGEQFSQTRMLMGTYAAREAGGEHDNPFPAPHTAGWRPTCFHPMFPANEPVPCTILDPFAGSGRAGLAAVKLGRNFIGIECSAKYVKMAEWQAAKLSEEARP